MTLNLMMMNRSGNDEPRRRAQSNGVWIHACVATLTLPYLAGVNLNPVPSASTLPIPG